MTNPFVAYLNSLHNDQSSNQNAIAEMHIKSPFFSSTQVERPLISYLCDQLKNEKFVVLTGHAGDGKTTLLAQVLAELGVPQTELLKKGTVNCGFTLRYIKDFSELTADEQKQELNECFSSSKASLLIANTGPLLKSMKSLCSDSALENTLLDAMDQPAGQDVSIEGLGAVFILNIARVNNIDFIKPYLKNLIADELWSACEQCPRKAVCPMLLNQRLLKENFERASSFIEKCYIWLQEYDNRATIRQITAHLTYAMTGGVSCELVQANGIPLWRYSYLFSNLFWGSLGAKDDEAARQIRGIKLLQENAFDQRATSIDYTLFVKNETEAHFTPQMNQMLQEVAPYLRPIEAGRKQRVLKRAYLLFGQHTQAADDEIQKQVFSEWFDMYLEGCATGSKPSNKVKSAICRAINTLFVGESFDESSDRINLTLRRNNEQTSNVQLLSGQIYEDDVSLRFEETKSISKNKKNYQLMLNVGSKVRFRVSLPLLNYFYEIKNGVIFTDIDPMLSNGIDSLKAQLLSAFSKTHDHGEATVLFLQGTKWRKRKLFVSNGHIDHE